MEKLRVVKIGGNVINKPAKLSAFLKLFSSYEGKQILVHGGGRTATELASKLSISTEMINGRRVTNSEMLDVCKMVYGGLINKDIVAQLQSIGCNAIGLSGADANFLLSDLKKKTPIDYGYIGIPRNDSFPINTLKALLNEGIAPVFCALTHDGNGQILNTNADTIASTIAIGASSAYEVELVYCFEKQGVLLDANDDSTVINKLNTTYYNELVDKQLIFEGMLPKLDNCFSALNKGVSRVYIKHADAINTQQKGTLITIS